MKSIEKQKICPNCEGRMPVEASICPYCAQEMKSALFQGQSLEDSLASLYKPPYQGKRAPGEDMSKNVEASLYGQQQTPVQENEQPKAAKSSMWPLLLLLLGGNLLVLGLMQLLFATDGILHLEFDASNWFFYCLAAAPLFYFGWKKLQELD